MDARHTIAKDWFSFCISMQLLRFDGLILLHLTIRRKRFVIVFRMWLTIFPTPGKWSVDHIVDASEMVVGCGWVSSTDWRDRTQKRHQREHGKAIQIT